MLARAFRRTRRRAGPAPPARGGAPPPPVDRPGRVADHDDREAARAVVERVAHERGDSADPRAGGDRHGDAEYDDARGEAGEHAERGKALANVHVLARAACGSTAADPRDEERGREER